MEEMSKKTKRLEKENETLTRKQNATTHNVVEMVEERTKTKQELENYRKKNEKLTNIINQMQKQGRGLAPGMDGVVEDSMDGEYVEGEESEYEDEDEEEEGSEEGEYDEDTEEELHVEGQRPYGPVPPPPPTVVPNGIPTNGVGHWLCYYYCCLVSHLLSVCQLHEHSAIVQNP